MNDFSEETVCYTLQNAEGLVIPLFHFLWLRNSKGEPCEGLHLPHTVVFFRAHPVAWYFTSQVSKQIVKKKRDSISPQRIDEALLKPGVREHGATASDVRGYLVYNNSFKSPLDPGVANNVKPAASSRAPSALPRATSIKYLTVQQARQFATESYTSVWQPLVLQQMVFPRESCNHIIRVTWAPHTCVVEKRTSEAPLNDSSIPPTQRLATYEAPEELSHTHSLNGSTTATMLQHLCDRIVQHVAEASAWRHHITRMVLNFRLDAAARPWLLYCSHIRLGRPEDSIARLPPTLRGITPGPDAPAAAPAPSQQKPQQGEPEPKERQHTFVCALTGQVFPLEDRCVVPFKSLVLHWMQTCAATTATEIERLRSLDTIPPSLLRALPTLTPQCYFRFRTDPAFLSRKAPVSPAAHTQLALQTLITDTPSTLTRSRPSTPNQPAPLPRCLSLARSFSLRPSRTSFVNSFTPSHLSIQPSPDPDPFPNPSSIAFPTQPPLAAAPESPDTDPTTPHQPTLPPPPVGRSLRRSQSYTFTSIPAPDPLSELTTLENLKSFRVSMTFALEDLPSFPYTRLTTANSFSSSAAVTASVEPITIPAVIFPSIQLVADADSITGMVDHSPSSQADSDGSTGHHHHMVDHSPWSQADDPDGSTGHHHHPHQPAVLSSHMPPPAASAAHNSDPSACHHSRGSPSDASHPSLKPAAPQHASLPALSSSCADSDASTHPDRAHDSHAPGRTDTPGRTDILTSICTTPGQDSGSHVNQGCCNADSNCSYFTSASGKGSSNGSGSSSSSSSGDSSRRRRSSRGAADPEVGADGSEAHGFGNSCTATPSIASSSANSGAGSSHGKGSTPTSSRHGISGNGGLDGTSLSCQQPLLQRHPRPLTGSPARPRPHISFPVHFGHASGRIRPNTGHAAAGGAQLPVIRQGKRSQQPPAAAGACSSPSGTHLQEAWPEGPARPGGAGQASQGRFGTVEPLGGAGHGVWGCKGGLAALHASPYRQNLAQGLLPTSPKGALSVGAAPR